MSKRPTVRDVADAANVSIATVSLVLRGIGRVSQATRERVIAVAEELRYRPDQRAIAFRTNKSRVVALVMAVYRDVDEFRAFSAFWADAITEFALRLAQRNYALVIVPPTNLEVLELVVPEIALIAEAAAGDDIGRKVRNLGVPLTSGDSPDGPAIRLSFDNEGMMEAAVQWLMAQGCSQPVLLAPQTHLVNAAANVAAFKKACAQHGLTVTVVKCGFAESTVAQAYASALQSGCDGVMSLVAGQRALTTIADAAGLPRPGVVPTVLHEDPRAEPGPGIAVITVSPMDFGRLFADAIADYLTADRTISIDGVIPFQLLTS
jgi:DNA-binding LacI/PurR family transcriptional regulator